MSTLYPGKELRDYLIAQGLARHPLDGTAAPLPPVYVDEEALVYPPSAKGDAQATANLNIEWDGADPSPRGRGHFVGCYLRVTIRSTKNPEAWDILQALDVLLNDVQHFDIGDGDHLIHIEDAVRSAGPDQFREDPTSFEGRLWTVVYRLRYNPIYLTGVRP